MYDASLPNLETPDRSHEKVLEESGVINKSDLVLFRDAVEADYPFIYSSWLQGLRYGNTYFECVDKQAYFKHQHDLIESILNDFETTVSIACLKEDPSVILGYAVYKNTRLDWVFIKNRWRLIGLARDLIPKNITSVSHITRVGSSILRNHSTIKFNPYFS